MSNTHLNFLGLLFGYFFFRAVIPPMTRAVQAWEDRRLMRKKIHDADVQRQCSHP
jgi:hypothetical protein